MSRGCRQHTRLREELEDCYVDSVLYDVAGASRTRGAEAPGGRIPTAAGTARTSETRAGENCAGGRGDAEGMLSK